MVVGRQLKAQNSLDIGFKQCILKLIVSHQSIFLFKTMQTFLPYPNYPQSARCLDNKRLGKQRVEVLQILKALAGESKGWVNHPATRMWRGHERALAVYGMVICNEWKHRGFNDTCKEKIKVYLSKFDDDASSPSWMNDDKFHSSHRSNLLRKDPDWYGQYGWEESDDLPYVWPV